MPGRKYNSSEYRYGFNGKEKDDDGEFGSITNYDYGFRIYNPAVGRFLSVDPLTANYSMLTPYQYASNTPIQAIDVDGLESFRDLGNRLDPVMINLNATKEDYDAFNEGFAKGLAGGAGGAMFLYLDSYTGFRMSYFIGYSSLASTVYNNQPIINDPLASPEDQEQAHLEIAKSTTNFLGASYGAGIPKQKDPLLTFADEAAAKGQVGAATETTFADGTRVYSTSGAANHPKSDLITGELIHTARTADIPANEQCFIGNCAEIGGMEKGLALNKDLNGAVQKTVQLGKTKSSISHGNIKQACTTCSDMQSKFNILEYVKPINPNPNPRPPLKPIPVFNPTGTDDSN